MTTDLAPVTGAEAATLAACEDTIECGLATFVDVGRALLRIRDERLYRAAHGTFEAYCEARWQMGRTRAYQYIEASVTVSKILDTGTEPPRVESQARELGRVPEPERAEVWAETLAATAGRPTAAAVREIASARSAPRPLPEAPTPEPHEATPEAPTLDIPDEYMKNFLRALHRGGDWVSFDSTRVAESIEPIELRILERHVETAQHFLDRVRRSRVGLRVIGGGAK